MHIYSIFFPFLPARQPISFYNLKKERLLLINILFHTNFLGRSVMQRDFLDLSCSFNSICTSGMWSEYSQSQSDKGISVGRIKKIRWYKNEKARYGHLQQQYFTEHIVPKILLNRFLKLIFRSVNSLLIDYFFYLL